MSTFSRNTRAAIPRSRILYYLTGSFEHPTEISKLPVAPSQIPYFDAKKKTYGPLSLILYAYASVL